MNVQKIRVRYYEGDEVKRTIEVFAKASSQHMMTWERMAQLVEREIFDNIEEDEVGEQIVSTISKERGPVEDRWIGFEECCKQQTVHVCISEHFVHCW